MGNRIRVTIPSTTAAEVRGLSRELREMQLPDLTANEVRDMRALLRRARKRMLASKVVPLRIAGGAELASAHASRHGIGEPTIDELFDELARRPGQIGR